MTGVGRLFASIVCLTSCATAPAGARPAPAQPPLAVCLTECGLSAKGADCASLQALEDSVLKNFERYTDTLSRDRTCKAFAGWTIVEHPDDPNVVDHCRPEGWTIMAILCVAGYTHEPEKQIEVVSLQQLFHGPLAHELVHVGDYAILGHPGHCRWKERGVKRALLEITGTVDESRPESDCP